MAPYDGNGNFTVDQPAFTSSTPISSSATNSNNTDFAGGLTNCVTKDGQSSPTAVIPLSNDGFNYASDPDTGIHRTAANTQAIECGGSDVLTASTTDLTDVAGFSIRPIVGEIRIYGLTTAPSGWHLCDGTALTATSPLRTALIASSNPYGVSGSDPLLPDLRGRSPFGKDTTGTRITVAGGNFNGNVLGGSQDRQNWTLTQAQLPAVAPTFTGTLQSPSVTFGPGGALSFTGNSTTLANGGLGQSITGIATLTGNATFTPAGTISNLGSGSAHPIVAGALIVNFIIFVGA